MSRKRWVYTEGGRPLPEPYEVSDDWTDTPKSTGDLGKFQYDVQMTDGTYVRDGSDYKKYLRRTGYVPSHEFQGQWAEAEKRREALRKGESRSTPERREALGRELYRRVKSFRG